MTVAWQVPPLPLSQLKKRPNPPPPVDGYTSAKRIKTSEPGGLVRNWVHNVDALSYVAKKNPIEFIDDDDGFVEGEFDKGEGSDMLSAVRESKPSSVRISSVSVSDLFISVQSSSQPILYM